MDRYIDTVKDTCDLVRKVFGSDKRIRIFERIADGARRDELREEFDDATLSQSIRRFERELDLVAQTNQDLELTSKGEEVAPKLLSAYEKVKLVTWLDPFLRRVPNWRSNLCDIEYLEDAEIVTQDVLPKAYNTYVEHIKQSSESRELIAQLTPASDRYEEQIIEKEMDCEFIGTRRIVDGISDDPRDDFHERWEKTEQVGTEYYVVDEDLPFTLSIFDDRIVTIIPASTEGVEMILVSRRDEVLQWANESYETYKTKAERIHPTDRIR